MNKRHPRFQGQGLAGKFLISTSFWCVALAAIMHLTTSIARADEYRAFWVDAWGAGFLNQGQVDALLGVPGDPNSLGTLREANCNSVIVQVRKRFDVCYPSGTGEPYMSGLSPANFNALAAMIKAAHDTTGGKKRIEVHCWSVAFKTAKGAVYNQHRDTSNPTNYWPTRIGSTNGAENADGAFDPGHPKVLEYLVNTHMDLVNFQTTAGTNGLDGHIDGLHYDYIRFEGNGEGFNPTSVARYMERHGLTNEPAASTELFKQWRRDQVTAFVRQMYARIQKTKPWIKHSGSFITWNPSPVASTRAAFQNTRPYYDVYSDWDSWIQEGLIDMAVPMTYYRQHELPNDYIRWMNFEKDRHSDRHMVIGPGVYLNTLNNAILHLNMTRDPSPAGNYAHGFCGYSYRVPYASGTWAGFAPTFVSQVSSNWVDIPDMPWKSAPTKGHVMGTVTFGGSGAWADHATVSISGPVSRNMYVDGTGFYAFVDLPPGSYTVTASKAGYSDVSANVSVAIGAVTGNMYEQNLVLTINAPPTISSHPQSRTVAVESNVTFSVTAAGTPLLQYKWLFEGAEIVDATNNVYTRTNAQLADAGNYSVIISNDFGSITSAPAVLTVITKPEPPFITEQPQGTNVISGQSAAFSVVAVGTEPLQYQWHLQGASISTATNSTFTRASSLPAHAGDYTVVITNAFGSITSQVAVLTVSVPPAISAQPQGTNVVSGQNASFSASASGTGPLFYQWHFQGNPLAGFTTANLSLTSVTTNQSGGYTLVVTNAYGAITSQVATLIVNPPPPPSRLEVLWQNYSISTNDLPYERGLTYNPLTHRVLLSSRFTTNIHVLDANNGSPLHRLNMTGVSGGQYAMLLIQAADDGAIYAGNLAVSSGQTFKVYRWANDHSNTIASCVFSNNPAPGFNLRWGDSFDVRGAGTNTQILLTPRAGTNAAILTTIDGTNFTSRVLNLDSPNGNVAIGTAFGNGDTFWGTTFSNDLRQITFDLNAGTGVTTRLFSNAEVPRGVSPIGYSGALNMIAGINVVNTNFGANTNQLCVYDLTLTNGSPILIGTTNFLTDNNNAHTGAGAVRFGTSNIVYALCANNGVMAVRIAPLPVPPSIATQPQNQTVGHGETAAFHVDAAGANPLSYQWLFNGNILSGATGTSWSVANAQLTNVGDYRVVITNAFGSVTSIVAALNVQMPLRFNGFSMQSSGQQFSLQGTGNPGYYIVEATSTPFTNWIPLTNVTVDANGNFEYVETLTNATQRFYRVREP